MLNDKKNQEWIERRKTNKRLQNPDFLVEKLRAGDVFALSKAITLVESQRVEDRKVANQLIDKCIPFSGKSKRIGISGVPGVGKSTFIESLGKLLHLQGNKIAVLSIDPSSSVSKGSILGDKTRMEELSISENVFIRPSPSNLHLGGVANSTKESMILCEAAGFDTIFIETVGVGQSEISVCSMVDMFILLLLPGAGDELQGIKRGVMELADLLVITKSDGQQLEKALEAKTIHEKASHYFCPKENNWVTKVLLYSVFNQDSCKSILENINGFFEFMDQTNWIEKNRKSQSIEWMKDTFQKLVELKIANLNQKKWLEMEQLIRENKISPFSAAELLMNTYFKSTENEGDTI